MDHKPYDLSNLTDKEMMYLERAVKKEKENRKLRYRIKKNLSFNQRIYDLLINTTPPTIDRHLFSLKCFANFYFLCDIVTGNYEVKKRSGCKQESVYCNSSALGIEINPEEYDKLGNDILDVIEKFINAKKSDSIMK